MGPCTVITTDRDEIIAIVARIVAELADNSIELHLLYADDDGKLDDLIESIYCGEHAVFFPDDLPGIGWEDIRPAVYALWSW